MDATLAPLVAEAKQVIRAGRREWFGLAVLALPCLLCSMDFTVLNLALPTLSAELVLTPAQALWVVDIYAFVLGSTLLPMGALSDRIGRRRLLMIGAGAFGCASMVAAFAKSPSTLIGARAALGLAGATLAPTTLSLIRNMFHDGRQRSVAIAVWTSSFSMGAILGPVVGGALLKVYWWGSVFLVGVPVMAVILVFAPLLLPEYRATKNTPLDFLSAILSLGAALPTIYGLKQMASQGFTWTSTSVVLLGLATTAVFVHRQKTLTNPMVDPKVVHTPGIAVPLAIYALGSFVSFGTPMLIEQYMQLILGLNPLRSGLWSLPCAVTSIAGALTVPVAARYIRLSVLVLTGLGLASAGFVLLSGVGETTSLLFISAARCLSVLGLAFVFNLVIGLAVGNVPPGEAGAISALAEAASDLGGALGIALLGCLSTAVYRMSFHGRFQVGGILGGTLASIRIDSARIGGDAGDALLRSAHLAYLQGFHVAMLATAATLALTAVLTNKWRAAIERSL